MTIPFVQAKHFIRAHRAQVDLLVIHTMEVPLAGGMATRVATGFAGGDREASAHYCIDPVQIVQCVHESDVAWHAPKANRRGIGLEHAGYADSSDWSSPEAQAMLWLSAQLALGICERWKIPVVRLAPEQIAHGERGICGHADVVAAFPGQAGTHHDPGERWPWDDYLRRIKGGG